MQIKKSDYLVMITSKETNKSSYVLVKDCLTLKEATDKLYENKIKGMKASEWTISKIERLEGGVEILPSVKVQPKKIGKIKRVILKNSRGKEVAFSMFNVSDGKAVIMIASPDNVTSDFFLCHNPHIMYKNSRVITELESDVEITSIEVLNVDKTLLYIMERPIDYGNDYFDTEIEIVDTMSKYVGNDNLIKIDPNTSLTISYTIE